MAKKVTELLEDVIESLNSKIDTEKAEQETLQEIIADAQAKLDESVAELDKAIATRVSLQTL